MTNDVLECLVGFGIDRDISFKLMKMIYEVQEICANNNIAHQFAVKGLAPKPCFNKKRFDLALALQKTSLILSQTEFEIERQRRRNRERKKKTP